MDKPAGIIAVLGASNYSSSLEMINAIVLKNCVVVHKSHHLNQASDETTDEVWAKILQPPLDHGKLSFCAADQGGDLKADERLAKVYFTCRLLTAWRS